MMRVEIVEVSGKDYETAEQGRLLLQRKLSVVVRCKLTPSG